MGNDGIGRFLLEIIKQSGLDEQYIQISTSEPSSIVLVTKSRGTPDFIAYRHADACISFIDEKLLEQCAVIHSTAFALSKQPAQSSILNAMERANSTGKIISIDWNFAQQIWGADKGTNVFQRVMQMKPLLKVSVDDTERFVGKKMNIKECRNWLDNYNAKAICLTCGKEGVWYKEKQLPWQFLEAVPIDTVIDVTGAGDAFWAGFLIEYMNANKIEPCVKNGLAVAAMKIKKMGPLFL